MEIIIKIAQFLLSLTILVFVHEMGHFTFARLFKIRVEKFRIFIDYKFTFWKKKIGETDFGIGWIPLGGYVKIAGMVDESLDLDQMKKPAKPWEFRSKPTWQRLLVMIGGVLYNLIFACLLYIISFNIWGEQYLPVENITDGFVVSEQGQAVGFKTGDKVLSIYGQKVERYSEINARLLMDAPGEVEVLRNGQTVSVYVREDEIGNLINDGGVFFEMPRAPFEIARLAPDGSAISSGLQIGDRITGINGVDMPFFDQYSEVLMPFAGQSVEVSFLRDDIALSAMVTLDSLGHIGVNALSPFSLLKMERKTYSLLASIPLGFQKAGRTTRDYVKQLKMLFSPNIKVVNSLGGFITIGSIFPSVWNWQAFWGLTAFLSILLGVMNILPIPALDGGHVILLLYEMITGKKPSLKFLEIVQTIGILFILALVILANGNDLVRLFFK